MYCVYLFIYLFISFSSLTSFLIYPNFLYPTIPFLSFNSPHSLSPLYPSLRLYILSFHISPYLSSILLSSFPFLSISLSPYLSFIPLSVSPFPHSSRYIYPNFLHPTVPISSLNSPLSLSFLISHTYSSMRFSCSSLFSNPSIGT